MSSKTRSCPSHSSTRCTEAECGQETHEATGRETDRETGRVTDGETGGEFVSLMSLHTFDLPFLLCPPGVLSEILILRQHRLLKTNWFTVTQTTTAVTGRLVGGFQPVGMSTSLTLKSTVTHRMIVSPRLMPVGALL